MQDVFISYAHVDNESLLAEHEGWVSIFHRALQKRLGQLLGRQASVWLDKKRLSGNHYFDDTIAAGVDDAIVMVSVVSPRYLKSDYCKKEVAHFAKRGVRVADKSKLFAVVKTPVQRDDLFDPMGGKLGYEFFRAEEDGGRFREYHTHDPELRALFMTQLEDLAQDISQLIRRLEKASVPAAPRESFLAIKGLEKDATALERVLVATTSGDVKSVREAVVRELGVHNVALEPQVEWSEDVESFEGELTKAADGVVLSVHILGAKYGMSPEDGEGSYPVLQFHKLKHLAAQRDAERPLARILWIPEGIEPSGKKQQAFIEQIKNDDALGPYDELLEGSEEELKERIAAKLHQVRELRQQVEERKQLQQTLGASSAMAPSEAPADSTLNRVRKIYVISADNEDEHVEIVEQALAKRGFDVLSSQELLEEETETQREALHQQWLEACDGCLIYHGKSKVRWVRAQIDEVRKALGHRETGPMRGHAIYVAPPIEGLKRRYQVFFPKLEGGAQLSEDLAPFLEQLVQVSELAPASAGASSS